MSCTGAHGGCMSNNCRSPRTFNNRSTHNSFLLSLHPESSLGWRSTVHNLLLSKVVILSSPFPPHECQLMGRFPYFQKMGGESSCTDTCLPCSSVFYIYILQTMSVHLHLNVNTECLRKRLSLFSSEDLHKEVCLCTHCRSIGIAYTGSAFCLAETDLLHQDIHRQQS